MRIGACIRVYLQAVREALTGHLSQLGFSLRKVRSRVFVAESDAVRLIFDANNFIVLAQRLPADFHTNVIAYDPGLLLEAVDSDTSFEIVPMGDADAIRREVDRMVRLLVEKCRPVLDGDDDAWKRVEELGRKREEEALERLGEAGLRLKDGDQWRELPELDAVRVRAAGKLAHGCAGLIIAVFIGLCALLFVGLWIKYVLDTKPSNLSAAFGGTVTGAIAIPLVIWLRNRVIRCHYYWQTSEAGLTIGMLFRTQTILWSEVESVGIVPDKGYDIRTSKGSVLMDKALLSNPCLEASIWQHLNRVGKGDSWMPSPYAASLWAQIPGEEAQEITWENPKRMQVFDILLRLAAWLAVIVGAAVYFGLPLKRIALVIIPSMYALSSAARGLATVWRVTVSGDYIDAATALGCRRIVWKSIRSVKFEDQWFGHPASMKIRLGVLKSVMIPWIPAHPNSTRVMLAILRRLRKEDRFRMLPFPTVLLLAAHGSEGQAHF